MDASHNRLRTPVRLEDNWVLKIPLLKAEKKYDRSSNLSFILLIFIPKINIFDYFDSVIKKWEESFLESFIQSEPHDSALAETYMSAIDSFFSDVCVSLRHHS